MSHCNWMFTWFNTAEDIVFGDNVKYAVWQKQRSEATGVEYLRGYVEFKRGQTLAGCMRIVPDALWEVRNISRKEAIDCCSKDDDSVACVRTHGVLMLNYPGRNNDLLELKSAIDAGI